jgi:hypothetical protein
LTLSAAGHESDLKSEAGPMNLSLLKTRALVESNVTIDLQQSSLLQVVKKETKSRTSYPQRLLIACKRGLVCMRIFFLDSSFHCYRGAGKPLQQIPVVCQNAANRCNSALDFQTKPQSQDLQKEPERTNTKKPKKKTKNKTTHHKNQAKNKTSIYSHTSTKTIINNLFAMKRERQHVKSTTVGNLTNTKHRTIFATDTERDIRKTFDELLQETWKSSSQ